MSWFPPSLPSSSFPCLDSRSVRFQTCFDTPPHHFFPLPQLSLPLSLLVVLEDSCPEISCYLLSTPGLFSKSPLLPFISLLLFFACSVPSGMAAITLDALFMSSKRFAVPPPGPFGVGGFAPTSLFFISGFFRRFSSFYVTVFLRKVLGCREPFG